MINIFYILSIFLLTSCGQSKSKHITKPISETATTTNNKIVQHNLKLKQNPTDFLPNGYVLFEKIIG